jgi:hypothetical protein
MNKENKMELDIMVTELLKNGNEQQIQEIGEILSNLNVNNRNNENIKNFTKKVLNKKNQKKINYVKFLESKSVNALITAPTQVGKSNATREFIETCFKANVPVIVSTDNKTDQCEQLYSRIEKDLCGADIMMMKVSDKTFNENFKECIKTSMKRFVIFCLDNSIQIEKLIMSFLAIGTRYDEMKEIKKIAIIHDEADQVTKDHDTEKINDEQAESHKKWLEFMELINKKMGYMDLKRVFVTATPENCVMLYKIESPDVMKLEIPGTYVGYSDIIYNELEDELDIKDILEKEVERISESGTNEVILYCIDRKIVDGHEKVLDSLSSNLKCAVNTYNGNGITAYMRNLTTSKKFEGLLKKEMIKYKKDGKYFVIKQLAIRKFYTLCKKAGEKCVVTIGKDLISRGISYVSEDKREPMTATTMIYKPGMSMHAVGICQTIGRITGCAMPGLKRRLYAPKDVIETYKSYNKNQEAYLEKMEKEEKLTKDIIDEMVFEKLKRHIDRTKLKLKMNTKIETDVNDIECTIDGVNINKLKKWLNENTLVGKMIKFLYNIEKDVSIEEFKIGVDFSGDIIQFKDNVDNGRSINAKYGKLWCSEKNNKIIRLNNNIREQIDEIYKNKIVN